MKFSGFRQVAALFALWLVVACGLFAQSDNASISGTVKDPSGSAIPNAQVTIVNDSTKIERRANTNEQGYFVVPALPPGLYTISATASGFKKTDLRSNKLDPSTPLAVEISLQVGNVSETVEVSASVAQVQTESAAVGKLIQGKQISELQLNGRNPIFLALLKPGVSGGSLAGFNRGLTSGGFSINGSRSQDNLITFDGAVAIRTRSNGTSIGVADLDSTAEVQVLTANYSAEYGRSAGGQIRIVTKSGGRDFHAAAYEYFRNDALDANSWSRKINPNPTISGAPAAFRYNQFGYNVNGPVIIPGWNKDRNKLFFLFGQEWIKFRNVSESTQGVPTLNARLLQADGRTPASAVNLNQDLFAGRTIRDPQTGQAWPGSLIPANRVSPNGVALMRAYPLPTPGFQQGTANWFATGGYREDHRKDTLSVDFIPTQNHFTKFRVQNYNYVDYQPFFGNFDRVPRIFERPNLTSSLSHVWTVNPTTIVEMLVTASVDRVRILTDTSSGLFDRTQYGINYRYLFPDGKEITNKIPTIQIGQGISTLDGGPYPAASEGPIYVYSTNLTKIWGAHTVKMGVLFERAGQNDFDQINVSGVPGGTNNQNGRFVFNNSRTGGSGFAISDAVLGLFDTYAEIGPRSYTPYRGHMAEWFVQDSWRVNSKLKLELGLRHSIIQPFYSKWGNMVIFDPTRYNPARAVQVDGRGNPVAGTGDLLNGLIIPGTELPAAGRGRVFAFDTGIIGTERLSGGSKSYSQIHYTDFAPRVGLAYSFNPKMVVRAGAGRFIQRLGVSDSIFLGGNPPLQPTASVSVGSVDAPGGTSGNLFPLFPTTQDPIFKNPEAWNWNFTFEREVGFDTIVTVGYVGRKGLHAQRERNINQLQVGQRFTIPAGQSENQFRPYRGYGPIRITNNEASSFYNGLQLEATRRFSQGFSYGFAYTYSKLTDNGSAQRDVLPNAFDANNLWGPATFDRRHVAILNVIYELPFFRNAKSFGLRMLGGWQVTGVSQWQSGTPITIASGEDFAGVGTGSGSQIWNITGDISYPNQFAGPTAPAIFYFDPTVFAKPANGTFTTQSNRGALYGPGFQNHNIGLFKRFRITQSEDRHVVTFRAEAFNWVNKPNLNGPGTDPNNPVTFGKILGKNSERQLQLSLRYQF